MIKLQSASVCFSRIFCVLIGGDSRTASAPHQILVSFLLFLSALITICNSSKYNKIISFQKYCTVTHVIDLCVANYKIRPTLSSRIRTCNLINKQRTKRNKVRYVLFVDKIGVKTRFATSYLGEVSSVTFSLMIANYN